MFTRRHYVMTANTIKKNRNKAWKKRTATAFATMYKKDNKRFDKVRFFVACGVPIKKSKKVAKKKSTKAAY